MTRRIQIARTAVAKAIRVRARCGVEPDAAVEPVDLALDLGIQVHFEPLPSLEGLYMSGVPPRIILGSDRPVGRRNFTCAHEIGHHVHRHGTRVDEYRPSKNRKDSEEFAADRFASALLMPKIAVEATLARRGWRVQDITAEQLFIIASELGVGYSTLSNYLSRTLRLISNAHAKRLSIQKPQSVRAAIAGRGLDHHLLVVDDGWRRPQINIEVGDVVLLSGDADDHGGHVSVRRSAGDMVSELTAISPGSAPFSTRNCRGEIRIAPRCYKGLADYRYLEGGAAVRVEAIA